MSDENNITSFDQRVQFVARRYREDALDADVAWRKFANAHEVHRVVSFRRYFMQAAAAVLLLVGLSVWYVTDQKAPDWVAITTAPGQVKDVYLPDSTLVALAGSAEIRYDAKRYNKERRAVTMRGKAFFQVTRNEACPFSVEAGQTTVTVLGTSFQVAENEHGVTVDVERGKVRFAAGTDQQTLTAGMSASFADQQIALVNEARANKWSWRTGQLRFKDSPLEQVIREVSDHYQVNIINLSYKEGAKLTATFNQLPLEDVLTIVNQTLDVQLVVQKEKND